MKAFRSTLDRVLAGAIGLLMAIMVGNVLWQVFTRFVVGHPSSFTEEAARYLMVWVGLLGAAYACGQKLHLALDLFTAKLEGARKRLSNILIHLVVLCFSLAVMVGGGGRLVWIQLTLGQKSAALQWKLGYVYLALPVAGAFIAVYSVMSLLDAVQGKEEAGHKSEALN